MPLVRVYNGTGVDLDRVVIYSPGPPRVPVELGALPNAGYSDYHRIPTAYRFIEIEISGPAGEHALRPYDFVDEAPLPEGRHTYRLSLDGDRLTLERAPAGDS